MVHAQDHGDDLGLHLTQAGEHFGVQGVRQQEPLERLGEQAVELRAAVVHGARHAPVQVHVAPVHLAVAAEALERIDLGHDPYVVASLRRQFTHDRHGGAWHERLGDIVDSRGHLALDAAAVRGDQHHPCKDALCKSVVRTRNRAKRMRRSTGARPSARTGRVQRPT